ncbi:MAG: hypothetical protein U5K69_27075 [Balneolaceae bacterium]|nr:hypothetical protein [Balneolaceae bacterium]
MGFKYGAWQYGLGARFTAYKLKVNWKAQMRVITVVEETQVRKCLSLS